ncbi:DNA polymerase lambda isoform X3 [Rhododendron vialii]|uniref:DNA polymerase lambda isoform X3 n=1 Tax=Rhododendron vialii TaxID=182163 RepID=UPI00265FBE5A|nr:DNA polymerase lambda isoform X3 [Rhododendron vialii]
MAPKRTKKQSPPSDPDGMFAGMAVFLAETGVQPRRLQIWKQKLEQMGASIEDRLSKKSILLYKWLEDSLSIGEKVSEAPFVLALKSGAAAASSKKSLEESGSKGADGHDSSDVETSQHKRIRTSPEYHKTVSSEDTASAVNNDAYIGSDDLSAPLVPVNSSPTTPDSLNKTVGTSDSSLPYSPPDQNQNITEIFGKLMNIYRALGDDRRSFSYSKAIAVIEKLPFRIESVDQVKHLPAIGKSMQDHIQEMVNTGKLSKLEHFETDEKVRTISLFGEVWGIGPATALKLYEKGHRTLEDLKNEKSLTNSQRLGLKYFDDIKTRIPRHEVQEMEHLLQNAAEEILPGVMVVCGGSYRRGKASCGDLDIVITHPDGKSHIGFLRKYVKHLKDIKFLREDLIFSIHSEEGTDAGVDTYFGLYTYPGRELRHRIDFKVYPRDIYAFGLIAWTGNDVLNRRLRLLADSKGYRLDDTGLFPATQSSSSKRGTKASGSLHFKTEKEVFDFLGFTWLEPHERNL